MDTKSGLCKEHGGQPFTRFCDGHNEPCCERCFSSDHSSCTRVHLLPGVAESVRENHGVQDLSLLISNMADNIQRIAEMRRTESSGLTESYYAYKLSIQHLRANVNQVLDAIEYRTFHDLDSHYHGMHQLIVKDIEQCNAMQRELQNLSTSMQSAERQYNECIIDTLADAEKLKTDILAHKYRFDFSLNESILQDVTDMGTFGHVDSNLSEDIGLRKLSLTSTPQGTSDAIYQAVGTSKHNVRTNKDADTCRITDCCQVAHDNIVLLDDNNDNVKLLSDNYDVLDICSLKLPRCLCQTSNSEFAVSVAHADRISDLQILQVDKNKLVPTRSISLRHYCIQLVHRFESFYVGDGVGIYVYNNDGTFIRTLYESDTGLCAKHCFSASADGEIIYIPEFDNNVLTTVSKNGELLSQFQDEALVNPTGICVAENGSVFVCGEEAKVVLQVDNEGKAKVSSVFVESSSRIKCLWFNKSKCELIVGQFDNEIIVICFTR